MIFGVIVAGGVGSRMGADRPKQFLDLAGCPIIIYTLKAFLECQRLEHIYMGVHPEWVAYMEGLIETYIPEESRQRVHLAAGGGERNDTIMNVIAQIEADFGTAETHYIITQDGVRPFVSRRLIEAHVTRWIRQFRQWIRSLFPMTDSLLMIFLSGNIYIRVRPLRAFGWIC